jgi:serine/threonine protein kinase
MGEVFAGRYELVDPVGRGGVGAVWRAWDHRRRRYVAAKVLQQSDAHALLRFVREQALRIDHPYVLAPASWAADDDKVLFTMDLVRGGSLAHLIGDYGPLSPGYVCVLVDQLLSGLAAVHAEGVVHRDIKPANILLEATGTGRPHVRLSDFGIAMRKGEPRLTDTNYVVGTPGYLAPEQMMGAEPDFPADLFAVGLVALYLLRGAKPDAKAIVGHFIEHGTPSPPQGIPEPLWQVLANLLQPDPEARFRTATGARKALASAAELLPEAGPDDELVEVFDQLGPLPSDFGPDGPIRERRPPDSGSPAHAPGPVRGTGPVQGTGPVSLPDGGTGAQGLVRALDQGTGARNSGADSVSVPESGASVHRSGTSAPQGLDAGPDAGIPASQRPGIPVATPGLVVPPAPAHPPVMGRPAHPTRHPGPPPVTPLAPGPAPTPTPAPAVASPPPSMSDTGSFHLPPPPERATAGRAVPRTSVPPPPVPEQSVHQQSPGQQPLRHAPMAPAQPDATPPTPTPTHVPTPIPASTPTTAGAPRSASTPAHVSSPFSAYPVPPLDPSQTQTAAVPREGPPTRPYTAQSPQVSLFTSPFPYGTSAPTPRQRRPGPPPKLAIPVLLLALLCFAVGIWALTRV